MARAAAIIGSTASGKSALALAIAGKLNAEIISVDSGAVYRGMDIGTATPDAAMLAQVEHHLINIVDPSDTYNVARFYHDAVAAAAQVQARGKRPLFVGGSMMYFNVLLNGLTQLPPVPKAVEHTVRQEAAQHGIGALYRQLQKIDSSSAAMLAPSDTQRIIRALCLYRSGGQPRAVWQQKHPPLPLARLLLLPANRTPLRQHIKKRLQQMWADGLMEETRQLLARWQLPPAAPPLKMAGYRQAVLHLQGDIDAATMQQKAYFATSQLAKRQLTWLQKWQRDAAVIDPFATSDLPTQAIAALDEA